MGTIKGQLTALESRVQALEIRGLNRYQFRRLLKRHEKLAWEALRDTASKKAAADRTEDEQNVLLAYDDFMDTSGIELDNDDTIGGVVALAFWGCLNPQPQDPALSSQEIEDEVTRRFNQILAGETPT